MVKLKRYDIHYPEEIEEFEDGQWVKYVDIDAEFARLRSENERLTMALDNANGAMAEAQEEVERLTKLISIVYKKIMNLDLPETSKYSKDQAGIEAFEEDLLTGKI